MFALITWLGFRQEYIEYDKQPRAAGRSGWTIARKIKLVVDSITAFSDAPIQACWLRRRGADGRSGCCSVVVGLVWFESLQAAVVVLLGAMLACTGLAAVRARHGRRVRLARARPVAAPAALCDRGYGRSDRRRFDGRSSARL